MCEQQKCVHFNVHDEGKVASGIFSLRRIQRWQCYPWCYT
jgi:hypothetical protein